MNELTDQEVLRQIKEDVTTQINPPHGPKHTIEAAVFQCIANRIDEKELEIIRLKAKLYDLVLDRQEQK